MSILLYHQSTVLSHVYYFIICIIESLSEGKSDNELQGTSPMDIHIFCKFIAHLDVQMVACHYFMLFIL